MAGFLKWLLKKPDLTRDLIKAITAWSLEGMAAQRDKLGTDGVLCMSGGVMTSNQLISSRQFQEFALPGIGEIQAKLRAWGYKTSFIHICGEQNDNLPYWSQVDFGDPAIISVGHEVKLSTAAKFFPGDIIYGNLEPAIVQTGTPQEVYEAARQVIEAGKRLEAGFIFATGCDLPPRAPVENVRMMTQAAEDFGWYD